VIKRSILSYGEPVREYKYYTASEDLFVKIIPVPAQTVSAETPGSEQPITEPIQPAKTPAQPDAAGVQHAEVQSKGFFANLWESIKNILFWKRK